MYEELVGSVLYVSHGTNIWLYKVTAWYIDFTLSFIVKAVPIIGGNITFSFSPDQMEMVVKDKFIDYNGTVYSFNLQSIKECIEN